VPVLQQYCSKKINPSFVDRSRVSLALLSRFSLTGLSQTQAILFVWSIVRYSLFSYYPHRPRCILSYRKKRNIMIRTTRKVLLTDLKALDKRNEPHR
ncbi:hypothetical protein LINGRAHAP2_LOCUS17553, partial [Linum grandiflorum]